MSAIRSSFNGSHIVLELLLHEAAANGDDRRIEELQSFIKRGTILINVTDEGWGNRTPLHCAAERGNSRCVKLLLESGANPYSRMTGGWTPAHCAAEAGKFDILKTLIHHGTEIGIEDDFGDSPRNIAEIYGHEECAQLLQRAEADMFKSKQLSNTLQVDFVEDKHQGISSTKT